jgi:hypothetical protein
MGSAIAKENFGWLSVIAIYSAILVFIDLIKPGQEEQT